MGRITTGIGLVSGINSRDIIDQLMKIESRPKTLLETRIEQANQKRLAYVDFQTRLTTLKLAATTLKKPSTFEAANTTSSNPDVLTATASNGAAIGAFQFQVARLVAAQQSVSRGFANMETAKVGAGTLTIELGGGELTSSTPLAQLRGGEGISRGLFRITDRAGNSAVIDITSAVTLEDVVKKINTALDIGVRASFGRQGLVLTDVTGRTDGQLVVQDLAGGRAAADLGILGQADSDTLTGGPVVYTGASTVLDALNDGRGVRRGTGADFTITLGSESWDISLATARTLGDVQAAIESATGGAVTVDFSGHTTGLVLRATGSSDTLSVTASGTSMAAKDLGLDGLSGAGEIIGDQILAGPNTTLLSSLRGGTGLSLGRISIQDRSGTAVQVDLTGARTVQDVIDAINGAGTTVRASLKSSGNGIQLTDIGSGTGNLVVSDVDSTTAEELGLAGSFAPSLTTVQGANMQKQWVSENMLLSSYNGGRGVSPGKFRITAADGTSAIVDLTQGNEIRLKDVIAEINSRGIGVVASINANGDGLLITDTSGGAGKLKIEDVDGTAARDLNILSSDSTTTSIDGSFERTIVLDATDTLKTVQQKINDLNFGVTANIINDGSTLAPYRLSLTSRTAGVNGRFSFDGGGTLLSMTNLVEAQDAAVFVGSADAPEPLLITSGSNTISNVVRGVNIELHSVSDRPVTLSVSRNVDPAIEQLKSFTEGFNGMVEKLQDLTRFDAETMTRGLLMGESTAQKIEQALYAMTGASVMGAGRYRVLSQIGLTVGAGAKLEFDEEVFREAWSQDPDAVRQLFTMAEQGLGWIMEQRINQLIDPVDGTIPRENKTIDERTRQFEDKIRQLDKQLEQKRARLERQFAQMESVLAGLQSQQQALASMQILQPLQSSRE